MDGKIMNSLDYDRKRYIECNNAMPKFQKYYRKSQSSTNMLIHSIYRLIFRGLKPEIILIYFMVRGLVRDYI